MIFNAVRMKMKKQEEMGFNFNIQTYARNYRMQVKTKIDKLMWARAFSILFELRARVRWNLKTTI